MFRLKKVQGKKKKNAAIQNEQAAAADAEAEAAKQEAPAAHEVVEEEFTGSADLLSSKDEDVIF